MQKEKEIKYYRIPDEYWYRIHFVRPRFKGQIEDVLLYMANECCKIEKCSCKEYSAKYLNAIRLFPNNDSATNKTLQNWRTEIPALFGFYTEDKENDITETSKMAKFLSDNQDLIQFLRLFLYSFQFPGGHIKPQEITEIINRGIKFKPTQSIIRVLMAGNEILASNGSTKEMSISAEEATYCIFNDLRVTRNEKTPKEIAETILKNRKEKLKYYNPKDSQSLSLKGKARTKGDMIRYAGDILDYMEIANLLNKNYDYFTLKENETSAMKIFEEDTSWFDGYDSYYGKKSIMASEVAKVEPLWFYYVNDCMRPDMFKTDIRAILENSPEIEVLLDKRFKHLLESEDSTTKETGDFGETIICIHEKKRVKNEGREDLAKLIKIVDSPAYHPGFDIDSFEADGTETHRYIEVKSTISKHPVKVSDFHMTTNEWRVAESIKTHYCVYRLIMNSKNKTLYILRNPVTLYKDEKIQAIPRDGMQISFNEKDFEPSELLTWENIKPQINL